MAPKTLLTAFFKAQQPFFGAIWLIRSADPIPVLRKVAELRITAIKTLEERRKKIYKDFQKKEDLQKLYKQKEQWKENGENQSTV